MKSRDSLLAAWTETLARKRVAPAVLSTNGAIVLSFDQIEARARALESKIDSFQRGEVIAVQIGNHEDWPSILLACLRRQLVVLPLEQSIGNQQRDAALKVCRVSALVSAVLSGNPEVLPLGTAASTDAGAPVRIVPSS